MLPCGDCQGPAGDTRPTGRVPRAPLVGGRCLPARASQGWLRAWCLASPPGAPSPTPRARSAPLCDSRAWAGVVQNGRLSGLCTSARQTCLPGGPPLWEAPCGGSSEPTAQASAQALVLFRTVARPFARPGGALAPAGRPWGPVRGAGRAHRLPARGSVRLPLPQTARR